MNQIFVTKRLTTDKTFKRPKKTFQETLSQEEIKKKLEGYKEVDDIRNVTIGSHIRYFIKDKTTNKMVFRLGGFLTKFGEKYKYIVLSNGTLSWSVQVPTTKFYVKKGIKDINEDNSQSINKSTHTDDEFENIKKLLKEKLAENEKLKKEKDKLKKKIQAIEDVTVGNNRTKK